MKKIIIDAELAPYGRLCSYIAKKALEGNEIIVVNSEKAIMSGNKKGIIEKYKNLRAKGGHSLNGPKYSRLCYKILKRGVRGMLPDHRKGIGKQAIQNVKCYNGIPEEFSKIKMEKIKNRVYRNYISLKELSEKL
jgi:large subunit ribosomal protein L13